MTFIFRARAVHNAAGIARADDAKPVSSTMNLDFSACRWMRTLRGTARHSGYHRACSANYLILMLPNGVFMTMIPAF
jgi:hypothetical protein